MAKVDRQTAAPFLLKLFYRQQDFHRLEEFTPSRQPSQYVQIYTWPDCTLRELSHCLTSSLRRLFPSPISGTRVAFRLIFPDMRAVQGSDGYGQFATKDLGSVVIGADSGDANDRSSRGYGAQRPDPDGNKSLQDFRFVIGDYVSATIIPPLRNGDVAPPPSFPGRRNSSGYPAPPPPPRNGYGRGGMRDNGPYRRPRGGGGFRSANMRDEGLPMGEWRRGERLPEGPRFRGQGGGRGRW